MILHLTLLMGLAAFASPKAPVSVPRPAKATQPAAVTAEASFGQLQHAIGQVEQGHYGEAIGELREFVSRYPDHVYSDYAHYWLAYAHFLRKEYSLAEVTTDFLIFRHPESFKLADAEGLNVLSRLKRGGREHASDELRQWLVRHPESALAPLAEATLFAPTK